MKKITHSIIALLFFGCGVDVDLIEELTVLAPDLQIVFPENNSECTAGTILSENQSEVTFEWSEIEGVQSYNIILINLATGIEEEFSSLSSSLPIILERGTPYQWIVDAIVRIDEEDTVVSASGYFYNAGPGVTTYIPFPADAISPLNGAQLLGTTTSINIEWTSEDLDNDIVSYDLYLGSSSNPELFAADIETPLISNVQVATGNQYYWRVVTKDAIGNESNSEIFSFEVE